MKRVILGVLVVLLATPGMVLAADYYPQDVLERYYECTERNDLDGIKELVWYHNEVERIDATIYGLPRDDFDDRSLLTINERLRFRTDREKQLQTDPNAVPMADKGPAQYPHHLREALDHHYEVTGERVDCSEILAASGAEPPPAEDMGSGWTSDLNLTPTDSYDRGEVDIVVDYANPNRIMASSCPSGGSPDSSSNFIAYSDNWGQSWTRTAVGNNSGTSWECDPVSYYQRSTGRVYHSKIGCSNGQCSQTYTMMRYSSNNGASWADCGRPGSGTSEDRQWHVVDNTPASSCYGNIYATWHNSNQEKVARSTNNCSSWTSETNLTGTYSAITPDINVGPDGHVFVVWQNYGDATFKIAGSSDCGASWSSPSAKTVKTRLGDWKNNIPAQCQRGISTIPHVDVDRSPNSQFYGRVYMTMLDFDRTGCGSGPGCTTWNNGCDYDMWFTYSDNNGATFAPVVNVTRDILGHGDNVDSFMGYMRVDEADGSIYAVYHRTRLNPTSLADRQNTHYFVARSTDGGSSWTEYQASTLEGNERLTGASSFERGDYNRLDVYEGVIYPVWIDRRGGTGEEEIITRKVCSEPAHWSERAPSYSAPATNCSDGGGGTVNVTWAAPDIYWGDGGETTSARKYQLYRDGSLVKDNISWTATSTNYDPGDSITHTYFVRAINQCGISKDYGTDSYAATGGCGTNPSSVSVTPDGPLTLCEGTGQWLSASASGGSGLSYQWTRNGSNISGATSSSYYANDSGTNNYNCVVTGTGCTTGVQDASNTQITWDSEPDFAGANDATSNASCNIDISWDAATPLCSTGVSYHVYRSTSSGFTPSSTNRIASCVSGLTHEDTGVSTGTTYYYVVRSEDGASGGTGPCNGGNIDYNTVQVAETLSSGGTQVLLDDDLTTGDNWVYSTGPGPHTCGEWALSTSSSQRPLNSIGNYLLTDSDACGSSSTTSTDVWTETGLNAAGATSLTLDYDIYYNHYNGDDATTQVWDGSQWVVVWADTNVDIKTHHTINVTAFANADFKVKFSYQNAAWDYWFAVDNVKVTAEMPSGCP